MRLAKFIVPAALVALPLGAQQDAPLTVSLLYSGVSAPAFSVNKAA